LYQELLAGVLSYEQLGNRLITLAEQARAVRRFDNLSELAAILINYPLRNYQTIGQYFWALSLYRKGQHNIEKARVTLEHVACNAPSKYRAKAMLALSGLAWFGGEPEETLKYCLEASKSAEFDAVTLEALWGIAVLKARMGDHQSAVRDLENLHPSMRYAPPHIYFDYLNSLAVELGEAGRKSEARNVIKLALASPYAWAYPEWQQTGEDLRPASRSFIVPNSSPVRVGKLLKMPRVERSEAAKQDRPARVISLQEWKMRTAKDETPSDKPSQNRPQTKSERVMYIMNHITAELTDEELDSIIERIDEVHAEKDKK
jgi:tetratricopeptide (TPR) repeat protein